MCEVRNESKGWKGLILRAYRAQRRLTGRLPNALHRATAPAVRRAGRRAFQVTPLPGDNLSFCSRAEFTRRARPSAAARSDPGRRSAGEWGALGRG